MTHYKRDTLAQLEREIEYGQIDLQVSDTVETFGFGVMNDGGGATYKIMKDERARTGDIDLPNGNIVGLQPYKQPKKKRKLGGRP